MCSNRCDMRRRSSVFLWSFSSFSHSQISWMISSRDRDTHENIREPFKLLYFQFVLRKCKSTVHFTKFHEIVNYRDKTRKCLTIVVIWHQTTWSKVIMKFMNVHDCSIIIISRMAVHVTLIFVKIQFRSTRLDLYVW